jgi:hypothetical protein
MLLPNGKDRDLDGKTDSSPPLPPTGCLVDVPDESGLLRNEEATERSLTWLTVLEKSLIACSITAASLTR